MLAIFAWHGELTLLRAGSAGNGRSRVEPLREAHIKQPKLHELPTVADAFRDQLKKSFNA